MLDFALGTQAQAGVPQPNPAATGLGPSGGLSAGFAPTPDLAGFAGGLVGKMSQDAAQASSGLDGATALQTGLKGQLSSADGVSIDAQMSTMIQLQNAYAANAKIITAVQSMYATLIAMVLP